MWIPFPPGRRQVTRYHRGGDRTSTEVHTDVNGSQQPPRRGEPVGGDPGPHDVYIGRGSKAHDMPPSVWGNPYKVRQGTREAAVQKHRKWLYTRPDLLGRLHELDGKVLRCHCTLKEPCHGDNLIEAWHYCAQTSENPQEKGAHLRDTSVEAWHQRDQGQMRPKRKAAREAHPNHSAHLDLCTNYETHNRPQPERNTNVARRCGPGLPSSLIHLCRKTSGKRCNQRMLMRSF